MNRTARRGAGTPAMAPQRPVAPRGGRNSTTGVSEAAQRPLRLAVPMPPSTNRLYATVGKRRVKTKEAREYAELVSNRVWLWTRMHGAPPEPPYRLTIVLYPPTRRRIDVSNSIKCLEDGLFDGLDGNDRDVVEVIARLGKRDPVNPRAEVTLEHYEPVPRVEPSQEV